MGKKAKIDVINVSDRASKGIYEDIPGKACVDLLNEWLITPFDVEYAVVPDEQDQIEDKLKRFSDDVSCSLIVTTGGTGPAFRDITPEATANVCQKMLPDSAKKCGKPPSNMCPRRSYRGKRRGFEVVA